MPVQRSQFKMRSECSAEFGGTWGSRYEIVATPDGQLRRLCVPRGRRVAMRSNCPQSAWWLWRVQRSQ